MFLGGYAIGTATEYLTSFLVEVILHTKWWDYTNNILNINGRVCLLYSVFWGVLTIFLVKKFNPLIDKILDKIKKKTTPKIAKIILTFIIIFLAFDCLLTCYAQDIFITRLTIKNQIEMKDSKRRKEDYQKLQQKERLRYLVDTRMER